MLEEKKQKEAERSRKKQSRKKQKEAERRKREGELEAASFLNVQRERKITLEALGLLGDLSPGVFREDDLTTISGSTDTGSTIDGRTKIILRWEEMKGMRFFFPLPFALPSPSFIIIKKKKEKKEKRNGSQTMRPVTGSFSHTGNPRWIPIRTDKPLKRREPSSPRVSRPSGDSKIYGK
jgi:hypothetical protein